MKSSGALIVFALAVLLSGQTQIDYNTRMRNAPVFRNFQSAQALPNGAVNYYGDPRNTTFISVPKDSPNNQILPGSCASFPPLTPPPTDNIPPEYRLLAAPHFIFTPNAIYACTPDGTGQGFHLLKLQTTDTW